MRGPENPEALLSSRLDFDVRVLEVPPVRERELEDLIRFRLRSIYPGNPQRTAFDYRLLRQGSRRRAVVFLCDRATAERYKPAPGRRPLLMPCVLLNRYAPRQGELHAWVCQGTWQELCIFQDGLLVSSRVKRDQAIEPTAGVKVMVVASRASLAGMRLDGGVEHLSIEELLSRARKSDGLFRAKPKHPSIPRPIRVGALVLLTVLLMLLGFLRYVSQQEMRAERLRARTTSILAVQREVADLDAELSRLDARRPRDVYLLISVLSKVLGDEVRISTLSVNGDKFTLEALGTSSFRLMESFKANPAFLDLTLSQVVTDVGSGKERFSISGVFRGR
jgi:hypothetical protein